MADATTAAPTPQPRKRRVWPRVLGWLGGFLVVVILALYYYATSSKFFKGYVLPRISKLLNAEVTVSSVELHPFSQIVLQDLKIQPADEATLVNAPEVRVRYNLFDILGGDIRVDEIDLASPTIQIVQNADGTSNLDPLAKFRKQLAEQKSEKPGKPSKPLKIDLRKLTLSNATILKVQNHKAGTRDLLELTNVDVTLIGVKNGDSGKLQFAAVIRDENNPPAPAMYGLLQAKIDGSFNFSLTPGLQISSILGDAHLNISQAGGSYSDFAKLEGALHCDLSPTEINTVNLSFEKDGVPLGELHANGPFDAQKTEGRLTVELLEIDRRVLDLFGAKSGIDFGSTTITCTNQIELTKSGAAISAVGQLSASKLQLSITDETTPPLELRADYNVSVDNTEKTALIRTLTVTGTQDARPLLRCELTSPMTLAWGKATNAVGDSSFNFAITKLNIRDWRAFAGNLASAGTLDLNLKLLSQQGGKRLTFDATNQIANLIGQFGAQNISDADVTFRARGQATNLTQFNLSEYGLQIAKSNHTALTITGSGTYDRASTSADLQVSLKTTIARMLQLLGQTNLVASSGTAEFKGHVTQKQQIQNVTGDLSLTNYTGRFAKSEFRNFGATVDLDIKKTSDQIDIRKAIGKLTEGRNAGGDFDISGTYSLTNKPSQLTVKLSDFNQSSLRPFLDPLLADKKLVSVVVDGTASARFSPNGDSVVKADLQITNLVVNDPAQQFPAAPLEVKVLLDAEFAKQIADIRQFQITLAPTPRAKNQFQIQGRVDGSKTNALQGNLKLTADSLDLTSYYDLFTATNRNSKGAAANKPQGTNTSSVAATTNQLPFGNFIVEANIRELYFREIAATNFQATLKLESNHIRLKPFHLMLNGSPVYATGDVDASVPGYKYALTFNATNVPFAPLWNTLEPERKGQAGGTLTAVVDMSGVGTTGESLQKTLTGKFDIGTTNLNLAVNKIRSPILQLLVVVLVKIPDIAENPLGTMIAIGGGGFNSLTGGLSGDVGQSPIDVIAVRGAAGDGRVILQRAVVRSPAFEADVTNGIIALAAVPTNSLIDIPIGISLNKSLSSRVPDFLWTDTATNAHYTKLPDFFSETGTIGEPRPKISPLAFARNVVEKLIPNLSGGTNAGSGNLLRGLGNLLQTGSTNHPSTNQSSTNSLPHHSVGPGAK